MDARYADVEDGDFQPRIRNLYNEAVIIAQNARAMERSTDNVDVEAWGKAFDEWKKLIPIAKEFTDLESSPKILRAKSRSRVQKFWRFMTNVFWALAGAVLSWLLPKIIDLFMK